MNNFLFRVSEIRGYNGDTAICGKCMSGTICSGERIRFADKGGGFDSLLTGVSYIYVKSYNVVNNYDTIIVDFSYNGAPLDLRDKDLWVMNSDKDPFMVVSDTFDITGRGIVLTGVIASGKIFCHDVLHVITPQGLLKKIIVKSIEKMHVLQTVASEGDPIGLLISGITNRNDVPLGSIVCPVKLQPQENSNVSMIVSDVFDTSAGVVVDGETLADSITIGDLLTYEQLNGAQRTVEVIAIVKGKIKVNKVARGESAGLLLKGLSKANEIFIGARLRPQEHQNITNYYPTHNPSRSSKRLALLIGNCNYGGEGQLFNCINDARALGTKLQSLGFDTTIVEDGDKQMMDNAIDAFSKKAKNAEVGFVFYSGHGMQCDGINYMIPIGTTLSSPSDIKYKCTSASYVLDKLEDFECRLKILVLDACRTNPFAKGWYKGNDHVGLGVMSTVSGTIVAFATSPDSVAFDGFNTANSPYTQCLLEHLDDPKLDIVSYFNKVSSSVYKLTNMKQNPWFSCSALTGDFYLVPGNQTSQNIVNENIAHVNQASSQPSHSQINHADPSSSIFGLLMHVEKVYEVGEGEVVLCGEIKRGDISKGDKVYLMSGNKVKMVQYVSGIESNGKICNTAGSGSRVGVKISGGIYTWQVSDCDTIVRH